MFCYQLQKCVICFDINCKSVWYGKHKFLPCSVSHVFKYPASHIISLENWITKTNPTVLSFKPLEKIVSEGQEKDLLHCQMGIQCYLNMQCPLPITKFAVGLADSVYCEHVTFEFREKKDLVLMVSGYVAELWIFYPHYL